MAVRGFQSWESTPAPLGSSASIDCSDFVTFAVTSWAPGGVKAVVHDRYGSPDVLRVEEVPVARHRRGPGAGEGAATSVNLSDWELRGRPRTRDRRLRFLARRRRSDIATWSTYKRGTSPDRRRVYGDNLRLKGGRGVHARAGIRARPQAGPAHLR
jgi:hypothetical protein